MLNQTLGSLSDFSKVSNSRVSPGQYQDHSQGYAKSTLLQANYATTDKGMTNDGDWGTVKKETVKPPLDQLVVNQLDLVLGDILLESLPRAACHHWSNSRCYGEDHYDGFNTSTLAISKSGFLAVTSQCPLISVSARVFSC